MLLALLLAVTLRGPADVASLTRAADAVVRAKVARVSSAWVDGRPDSGVIVTTVELAVSEQWKGAPQTVVTLSVPGGSVGDLGQIAQGAASFAEGEEVVVFLKRRAPGSPIFAVERWGLGKFNVAPKSGRVLRSREGIVCSGCRPGEPDEFSIDDLRARVKAAQ